MTDQSKTTVALVAQLDAAARRWWVPAWLSDLLTRASAEIEAQHECQRILRFRLDVARGDIND